MTAPEAFCRSLDALTVGVCLADPSDWSVVAANKAFGKWFPGREASRMALSDAVSDFDRARAALAVEQGRRYAAEISVSDGAHARALQFSFSGADFDGRRLAVVEFVDATSRRRVELMLDSYSRMAERNARDLQREKERVEKLLLNVMPRSVYEELRDSGAASPQRVESATVLMLDFVGFTEMSVSREVSALIGELNDIFSAFDRIVEMFGSERIKTIGDGYLAIAGMPTQSPDDALNVAKVAVRMRRYLERRNATHPSKWLCRIGIATGPLIGSLVGVQKYVYDVFGPTVNLAARLEHISGPMEISVCDATAGRIAEGFALDDLGEMEMKGLPPTRVHRIVEEYAKRAAA